VRPKTSWVLESRDCEGTADIRGQGECAFQPRHKNASKYLVKERMAERDRDEVITVNCGRCGKSLIVRLGDIKEKRTIDCAECENKLPAEHGVSGTHAVSASGSVDVGGGARRHTEICRICRRN